jgi:NAD(P)-dependent dehydrogenase (short-subunit alcohol dehydrogenase family)
MDLGIKGKWALVGGASKGLGWGCARALALEGVLVERRDTSFAVTVQSVSYFNRSSSKCECSQL